MTQEDKELLLKDLSARLPYKPICFKNITNCIPGDSVLFEEDIYSFRTGEPTVDYYGQYDYYKTVVLELKPYLRRMSSMTEEECDEIEKILGDKCIFDFMRNGDVILHKGDFTQKTLSNLYEFYNSHHFDYLGLIEKNLAIAVTKENNPYD